MVVLLVASGGGGGFPLPKTIYLFVFVVEKGCIN